jgi:hypothetical protein
MKKCDLCGGTVTVEGKALADAAVPVRYPERKEYFYGDVNGKPMDNRLYNLGFNDCLDEIKRLNNIQTDESGKD